MRRCVLSLVHNKLEQISVIHIFTTNVTVVVTIQEGEMGDDAGKVVRGCGEGDMGGILVLSGARATSEPPVWEQVKVGITSEVPFHVLRVAPHLPSSCCGDLTKDVEPASQALGALRDTPPTSTRLRQAD